MRQGPMAAAEAALVRPLSPGNVRAPAALNPASQGHFFWYPKTFTLFVLLSSRIENC